MTVIRLRIPAFWLRWCALDDFDRTLIIITGTAAAGVIAGMVATFRHWGPM